MGEVLPFAPVREIRVELDFGLWCVSRFVNGRLRGVLGRYDHRMTAERAAALIRRLDHIPSPRAPALKQPERLPLTAADVAADLDDGGDAA